MPEQIFFEEIAGLLTLLLPREFPVFLVNFCSPLTHPDHCIKSLFQRTTPPSGFGFQSIRSPVPSSQHPAFLGKPLILVLTIFEAISEILNHQEEAKLRKLTTNTFPFTREN
jgi:hypothetical protein